MIPASSANSGHVGRKNRLKELALSIMPSEPTSVDERRDDEQPRPPRADGEPDGGRGEHGLAPSTTNSRSTWKVSPVPLL